MAELRVRIYNMRFGDAILVSIPEADEQGQPVTRTLLFDTGNALAGKGGEDALFSAVLANIRDELGGQPVDLYVMTHEHMDHVQGPLLGSKLGLPVAARQVWMTASSAEDYYQRFPEARKKRALAMAAYDGAAAFLNGIAGARPVALMTLLELNNPRSSKDCVDHIRGIAPGAPLYLDRTVAIEGMHPFRRTRVRVMAPEADTSVYYGRLRPRTLGAMPDEASPAELLAHAITPPAGVGAGDFFDLVRFRSSGLAANLRSIDKAANNSSVVIELEWEGWRLLFPGDAEEKSWEIMERQGLLRSVHFLKVSHHGSANGSPPWVIDRLLPEQAPDDRLRRAVVSTSDGAYSGVPDGPTLELLKSRGELLDTRDKEPGAWIDITFPEGGVFG